jgi:hypothetical protein
MEKGDRVAAVTAQDLKTVWDIRKRFAGRSVDEVIFRQECKPETDVVAAAHRAALLDFVMQTISEFRELIQDGQPNDVLLEVFAEVPLLEDGGNYRHECSVTNHQRKNYPLTICVSHPMSMASLSVNSQRTTSVSVNHCSLKMTTLSAYLCRWRFISTLEIAGFSARIRLYSPRSV